jgi:putative Holliday junction resolvase
MARLIREQGVDVVVVGHPLNDDGSAGPQARRIERYAEALVEALEQAGLDVDVVLWDERMSTLRAQEAMIEGGRSARTRRQRIDAAAAAVILQDYLDTQAASGPGPGRAALDPEEEIS